MSKTLTDKQRAIFDYCVDFFHKNHRLPSHKDVCQQFNFTASNSAAGHLKALVKKGWLEKTDRFHYKFRDVDVDLVPVNNEVCSM